MFKIQILTALISAMGCIKLSAQSLTWSCFILPWSFSFPSALKRGSNCSGNPANVDRTLSAPLKPPTPSISYAFRWIRSIAGGNSIEEEAEATCCSEASLVHKFENRIESEEDFFQLFCSGNPANVDRTLSAPLKLPPPSISYAFRWIRSISGGISMEEEAEATCCSETSLVHKFENRIESEERRISSSFFRRG